MTYIPLDTKTPFVQNLLDEILSIDPLETSISLFNNIFDIVQALSPYEKQLIEIQLKKHFILSL